MNRSNIRLFLQRALPLLIGAAVLLALLGLLLYPSALQEGGLLGIIADIAILLIYGYLFLLGPLRPGKTDPDLLLLGLVTGAIGALVLCADLLSDYFIRHDATASATSSLLAYGIFLVLALVAGVLGAVRKGTIVSGLVAALWSVAITSLVWFFCEFAGYYLFGTSGTGADFIRQEMQADFARSGSSNYQGFVMSDFFGAGFFHPLLLLVVGALLGLLGGLIGLAIARLLPSKPRRTEA